MRTRTALSPSSSLVALAFAVSAGCGGGLAVRDAEHGDYAALRTELAKHRTELTYGEAHDVAAAVAAHDLDAASVADGAPLLRIASRCAKDLESPLLRRAKKGDPLGATAATVLFDADLASGPAVRDYARGHESDPAWRSAVARTYTERDDRAARLAALLDPQPEVRRAAAAAAGQARDPEDLTALAESARTDPEPLVQTTSLRGLIALASAGEVEADAVMAKLRDLWISGDDPMREDIASAWGRPPLFTRGGREALETRIGREHGPGVIAAAVAVLRYAPKDAGVAGLATNPVTEAIRRGSRIERLHAIATTPLAAPEITSALTDVAGLGEAGKEGEPDVRIAALLRLSSTKESREKALAALEKTAQDGSPTSQDAKMALAAAGDLKAQGWLEADMAASDTRVRAEAADGLAMLGRPTRAAPLLADQDAGVRMRASCSILAYNEMKR